MPGNIKITKRQIKEDKFTTFMLTTKDQVAGNWQFVVAGAVIVVLCIVAVVYYINSQQARTLEAGELFARSLSDYRNGDHQVAILGLNQIVEDYSSDDVAEEATYLLGKLNLIDRNYPEAIRYFELYVSKYHDNSLNRAAALAGIAACYENQGEFEQAAAKFLETAQAFPESPLAGDYQFGALRNYLKSGDLASAKERLDVIQDEFSGTEWLTLSLRLFHEKGQTHSGT